MNERSASSTAGSSPGSSQVSRRRFHRAFARAAASRAPSEDHCSYELLSEIAELKNAVRKFACVCVLPRKCAPGPTSRMASIACPFSERSTPSNRLATLPQRSASRMVFS